MELKTRLAEVQQALKAPKSEWNDFSRYPYRTGENIIEAVKPILSGLLLTISDEVVAVGDRIYVKATARIEFGSESIEVCGWARESLAKKGMDDSQITGSTSSYARKYALNGLFLIDDAKDADSMDNRQKNEPVKSERQDDVKWYNDFDRQKSQMLDKLRSGEQTAEGIIQSLKKSGYKLSGKTEQAIKALK